MKKVVELPKYSAYPQWAKTELRQALDEKTKKIYQTNATAALSTAQAHPFFSDLDDFFIDLESSYKDRTGTRLFTNSALQLTPKTYDSVVNKSYRTNIIKNKNFPSKPQEGWITPDNWMQRLNDTVRGELVCAYLDGPEYVAQALSARADKLSLASDFYSRQQDSGYYAYHFYVDIEVELVRPTWRTFRAPVRVEVQLTTQLQEVLRALTHVFYEELRLQEQREGDEWKWNYSTGRFKASYLGHTLHLLEGTIMELRHTSQSSKASKKKKGAAK
ncbi:hypothetical protein [Pyxidicoccus trucidator]|uniref:hypothetical protein n=1 Tax=Pyxidicoccus trucidator TaxID=2709662 RepID=UPI0013DAECE5|nr:hypothetical protein [Pyxidicoccus trucidator]